MSPQQSPETCPRALGYRWPAEWEPHAATWLAWPHNVETWPGAFEKIPPQYARFVEAIAAYEPVNIIGDDATLAVADSYVGRLPNVTLHEIPTNDSWIRDFGPFFLEGGLLEGGLLEGNTKPAALDFRYNAWGEKYPPYDLDDSAAGQIISATGRQSIRSNFILEGGSVETNGTGVLLTTSTCLLHPKRNPTKTQVEIEALLKDNLAVDEICWLTGDLQGDDTDGHIDQLARFVAPEVIVVATEDDGSDKNYASLKQTSDQLTAWLREHHREMTVVSLPMPTAKFCEGQRLPASYANFYIINGAVIVPVFNDPADDRARAILQEHFPQRDIIPLPALDIVWGLGAFHCLSMQECKVEKNA